MTFETIFPPLTDWEPTRETLHLYTKAVGVIPREHARFHPRWWHISLRVLPDGLVTYSMTLPSGREFWFRIDFHEPQVIMETDQARIRTFSMLDGLPASTFGNKILEAVQDTGLAGYYDRDRFESHEPRQYNPAVAAQYFSALLNADRILKKHRESLDGEKSPL